MQQAVPYSSGRTWFAPTAASNGIVHVTDKDRPSLDGPSTSSSSSDGGGRGMRRLVAENPVLVVGRQGCCLCHVVKKLLLGLGVNPAVCEVAEDAEPALVEELAEIAGCGRGSGGAGGGVQQPVLFPAVFIGGRLVGGLDRLMAVHISGDLVPILKEAGALWL
ncbi:monothiol glutaredoxin-S9-like [Phoenix dactylifera]|uniref:Monothiol glutaredoxin-S9-like n=1 Tax=Phoenix dactylifera TaxID=42345 RepID=A0A8B7CFG1_PHODC|nr:monothiol glutaredoxin-S9-like [Phoenix dactylifera]